MLPPATYPQISPVPGVSNAETREAVLEWLACSESVIYFVNHYVQIYDATLRTWIPFKLWPAQARTLKTFQTNRLVTVLKARQLGITWLALSYALWLMLFHSAATVMLFSRRDAESIELLGEERLKGMYSRLPTWAKARAVVVDNGHVWTLSNGSSARAFPTSAGDSYTASLVICDEFDLLDNQDELLKAVKPTIDGGGKMFLISRPDKAKPSSSFKRIYLAARAGETSWKAIFLPWSSRPSRDAAWYADQSRDVYSRTGSLDDLHEQYPASDAEALSASTSEKRFPSQWVEACYQAAQPIPSTKAPVISGLKIYRIPEITQSYVIGADPAEGTPTSDFSAATVMNHETGEEVASLAGLIAPDLFSAFLDQLSTYYNKAPLLPERNNHGHAVIMWLREHSKSRVLTGADGKPGYLTTTLSKSLLLTGAAEALRDHETQIHTIETRDEIMSIETNSMAAPLGLHDDRAMSYFLAIRARRTPRFTRMASA